MSLFLGVLSILAALVLGVLFGWIGCIAAFVLAVVAIFLGKRQKKNTSGAKGRGGIITGVISIVFSIAMVGVVFFAADAIRQLAYNKGFTLLADHADRLSYGIIGMMISSDGDEGDLDELRDELNSLSKRNSSP